jgi:hypothetical protein
MIEGSNDSDGALLGWSDGSLDGIDEGLSDSDGALLG